MPDDVYIRPGGFELQDYVESYLVSHGYAPSIREIRDWFGCDSISTAHLWLKQYRREGFVDWLPNQPRTYHIPRARG